MYLRRIYIIIIVRRVKLYNFIFIYLGHEIRMNIVYLLFGRLADC